ncbi:MAG: recombinase family protein [Solidesulfovibrio sp. DCME]|uniref:recombinase family protein n=1 Tax=Solidesulfovibrio sp. DCME TaxID=3447380 RepID=UPI003D0EB783
MERVFGYVRVSSPGQVQGDGLARQAKAIADYARAHRLEVVRIYREEGVSGTSDTRPALAELMVDLEENGHGVKTVIVEKLDRLARDLMVQEAVIRDFQKHGFNLISATEGPNLLSEDPTRKFVRQVFGALAEYDKSMLVSKLRAARERVKAKTGKCDGRKGYYETDHGKAVLARIKQLRRKRRDMKPLSFPDIAGVLNKEGILTLAGKHWTGGNVAAAMRRNQKR